MSEPRIKIKHLPTGTVHFAGAAGGPKDGSLAGFSTYCGQVIDPVSAWEEGDFDDASMVVCESCLERARRLN
jgi:hypothetical protein